MRKSRVLVEPRITVEVMPALNITCQKFSQAVPRNHELVTRQPPTLEIIQDNGAEYVENIVFVGRFLCAEEEKEVIDEKRQQSSHHGIERVYRSGRLELSILVAKVRGKRD